MKCAFRLIVNSRKFAYLELRTSVIHLMDLSKLRFLRRAVAFLSFTIAILALVNFVYRVRPDSDNLVEIKGKYTGFETLPSGDVLIELEGHEGTVYIKSNLAVHLDSEALAQTAAPGATIFMDVEKEGVRQEGTYSGNILSLHTADATYLPIDYAMNAYQDAVHSARRGFIQFLILTLVLLVPEITSRRRRIEEPDSGVKPIAL